MTSQIVAILALCISWIWWVTFIISLPATILLQVMWCRKIKKLGVMAVVYFSILAALCSLFAGIWIIVDWKGEKWCKVFTVTMDDDWWQDDDYWTESDYCQETAWAIAAFCGCILWIIVAANLFYFVSRRINRICRCEKKKCNKDTASAIPLESPDESNNAPPVTSTNTGVV